MAKRKVSRKDILAVIECVDTMLIHSATKFISPTQIVRATRKLYGGKIYRQPGVDGLELVLKLGRPNYLEREYVKLLKKAGEPFPVRKIWLRYPPKKRAA